MSSNITAKSLTDSAILTALTILMVLVGNFLGLFILTTIVALIPLALIYVKYDFKTWTLGSLVTIILTFLFTGVTGLLTIVIPVIIVSFAYGYAVKKKKSGNTIFSYLIISNIIAIVVTTVIDIYVVLGTTFKGFIQSSVVDLYKPMIDKAINKAAAAGNLAAENYFKGMINLLESNEMIILALASLVIISLIMSLITMALANKTLNRINFKVDSMSSFDKWYIDPKIALIYVVVAIFGTILSQNGFTVGSEIIQGALTLFVVTYFIQGLSFICHLITRSVAVKSKGLPVMIVILVILLGKIAFLFLGILGIIDLLMDTRNVNKNSLRRIIKGII